MGYNNKMCAHAGDELGEEAEKGQQLLKELREALHVMCPNPLVLPEQRVRPKHSLAVLYFVFTIVRA
jgi:hypothetical protein